MVGDSPFVVGALPNPGIGSCRFVRQSTDQICGCAYAQPLPSDFKCNCLLRVRVVAATRMASEESRVYR